jgi:hypothetical protein
MLAKILIILTFCAPVLAVNKCVVDGKTIYTQHQCPEGTNKGVIPDNIGQPKQSPASQESGTSDYWINQGYAGGAQQYRYEQEQKRIEAQKAAERAELIRQANTGPDGSMSPTEYGNALRAQKAAQRALGWRNSNDDVADEIKKLKTQIMINETNKQIMQPFRR